MRTVIIKDISYECYQEIRDELYSVIPYAMYNENFCNGNAYFMFWDGQYVPDSLAEYITAPPRQDEEWVKMSKNIAKILAD